MYVTQGSSLVQAHPQCFDCKASIEWLRACCGFKQRGRKASFRLEQLPQLFAWQKEILQWGPSRWPFYWCNLQKASIVDCGVFANIVELILHDSSYYLGRVQAIEEVSELRTRFWVTTWKKSGIEPEWVLNPTEVYHEMILVTDGKRIVLYDPTERVLINDQLEAVNRICSLRVTGLLHGSSVRLWDCYELKLGCWVNLDYARDSRSS